MFVRIALFICALGMLAVSAAAQKTVTNLDLTRYRDQRVRAEDELRQEYERKGTSYDEVMRRNKESQKEMIDLSAKLRAARLESERIAAEREAAAAARAAAADRQGVSILQEPYWTNGWYSVGNGFRGRRVRFGRLPYQQPGYYAGGQFWPTGPATPPRPLFTVRGRHR